MKDRRSYFILLFYCTYLVLLAFYCFKRPLYNWDTLPYAALVLHYDHQSFSTAFEDTYAAAKKEMPASAFRLLTDSTNTYRYRMYRNADAFNGELPFYVVKPLYTCWSYVGYKLGMSLMDSTLLPGLCAYIIIGILILFWLRSYLRPLPLLCISMLLMGMSPMIEVAKLATPDCLSAFFLLGTFYFIAEKRSWRLALVCMVLAILTRLDNIVVCMALLILMRFAKDDVFQLKNRIFWTSITLMVFVYLIVGVVARPFGWSVLFYDNFVDRLQPKFGSAEHFSIAGYARMIYDHFMSALNHSFVAPFLIILVLNFIHRPREKKMSFDQMLLALIPLVIAARFILYPDISDRFYVAFYLFIVVLTIKRLVGNTNLSKSLSGYAK